MRRVTRYRPWLVPGILAAAAFVLLVAGVLTWQMRSSPGHCPAHAYCGALRSHRHHPLRAELMWVAAGLLAIVAAEAAIMQRRLPQRRYHGHVSGRPRG